MENTDFGGIKFDLPKNQSNVIKVIGVGGGGSNAINHMFQQGIKGVDFIVCNTDSQALENSPVPTKIQLGVNLTEGLGAGANPEVGQQSALESIEEIEKMLDTNTKMVFITAGMGGGTGTGAAPVIAQLSKERDILTVGIVTIPFQFEGKVRQDQALKGVERLRKQVDSLVVINNNKLREVYGNLGFKAGFSKADEVLSTAARGIAEVITHHYTQNIDLKDAKTVLSDSGTAIMGSATASGETRAKDAIVDALDSPLLNDNKISGAKNVLLLIVSGANEITIDEIGEINDHIQTEAGHNANIIMGVGEDESLGDAISVTIIATGFNIEQQKSIVTTGEPNKIIHVLEGDQKLEHNLMQASSVESFGYSSPDEPLSKVTTIISSSEDAVEETEKITVHQLGDFEDEDLDEGISVEAMNEEDVQVNQVTAEATEKASDANGLDVFFEIVTPSEEVKKNTSISEEQNLAKTKDIRDINVVDPEFVIVNVAKRPETQVSQQPQANAPVVYHLEDDMVEAKSNIAYGNEAKSVQNMAAPKEEIIMFSLEDYTDKESELASAKPINKHQDAIEDEFRFSIKSEEPTPAAVEASNAVVEEELDEVNPIEMSIEEFTLKSRAAERRKKMKEFNYKFNNTNSQLTELEREPAYKRSGVDLHESDETTNKSRITFGLDSNNDGQLRSNNSYLHDNVD
ncbi:cell division protein FtsZ [Myroides odoratimimus CCUG 12901]|uniref:cell division protein FtsZ n=1 Tax=Myroides odoratimimus TaxID=76832 RepID=UPI000246131B|nr:cell division protein FtsZ [Myroides odoratimimus]EHO05430.1 cell division protein FtsZ [Myroides odoratimimus CCUG 12901]